MFRFISEYQFFLFLSWFIYLCLLHAFVGIEIPSLTTDKTKMASVCLQKECKLLNMNIYKGTNNGSR